MRIQVISVGSIAAAIDKKINDYAKRIPRQYHFQMVEIPAVKRSKGMSIDTARDKEWQRMLAKKPSPSFLILMDERGKETTSQEFAQHLSEWQVQHQITFLLGGADGFSTSQRQQADLVWSLSKLTFPHDLARLLLVEQIYRASTIHSGHPYHRD